MKNQCISCVFQIRFAGPFHAIGKREVTLRNYTMRGTSSNWIPLGPVKCPPKGSSVNVTVGLCCVDVCQLMKGVRLKVRLYILLPEDNDCCFFPTFLRTLFDVKTIFSKNSRNIYFLLASFIDFPTIFTLTLFYPQTFFVWSKEKFDADNLVFWLCASRILLQAKNVTGDLQYIVSYIAEFSLRFGLRFWIVTGFGLQTNAISG